MASTGTTASLSAQAHSGFLISAIEIALALLEVAAMTSDLEDVERYQNAAGKTHDMVAQLAPILRLEPDDRQVIEEKLRILDERLAQV